jgi:hypothetical protein
LILAFGDWSTVFGEFKAAGAFNFAFNIAFTGPGGPFNEIGLGALSCSVFGDACSVAIGELSAGAAASMSCAGDCSMSCAGDCSMSCAIAAAFSFSAPVAFRSMFEMAVAASFSFRDSVGALNVTAIKPQNINARVGKFIILIFFFFFLFLDVLISVSND